MLGVRARIVTRTSMSRRSSRALFGTTTRTAVALVDGIHQIGDVVHPAGQGVGRRVGRDQRRLAAADRAEVALEHVGHDPHGREIGDGEAWRGARLEELSRGDELLDHRPGDRRPDGALVRRDRLALRESRRSPSRRGRAIGAATAPLPDPPWPRRGRSGPGRARSGPARRWRTTARPAWRCAARSATRPRPCGRRPPLRRSRETTRSRAAARAPPGPRARPGSATPGPRWARSPGWTGRR